MNILGKNVVDDSPLDHDCDNYAFDRKLQQWHATGLVNVSAATLAQLHQRRRSALAGHGPGTTLRVPGRRLVWADALALLAIAIALPAALLMPHGPDSSSTDATITSPNRAGSDLNGSNLANSSFTDSSVPNDSIANSYRTPSDPAASAGSARDDVAGEQTQFPGASLEEDPDLFLWLDSRDAIALASE